MMSLEYSVVYHYVICSCITRKFPVILFLHFQVKSMAQYLESADKFFYPRKDRFHERYLDDVSALVHSVTLEVIRKQERVKLAAFFHSL